MKKYGAIFSLVGSLWFLAAMAITAGLLLLDLIGFQGSVSSSVLLGWFIFMGFFCPAVPLLLVGVGAVLMMEAGSRSTVEQ